MGEGNRLAMALERRPISSRRLILLYALCALTSFAFGGMFGSANRIADRYTVADVAWGSESVQVRFEPGSPWRQAGSIVLVVVAVFGLGLFLRKVARMSLPEPGDGWRVAPGILAMCVVIGLGVGWQTEPAASVPAQWMASALVDHGEDVGAELLTGYVPNPRSSNTPIIPAAMAFPLDGAECVVTVVDDVTPVNDQVDLPVLCTPR